MDSNKESDSNLTISNIVHEVEYNMMLLLKLVETLLYRCKSEALILEGVNKINENNYDLELEI